MATINNVSYSWSMFQLSSSGLTGSEENNSLVLLGVSGFKWSRKQKVETNYGLGGKPIGRGFGNWECSASITMDYATQQQIRALKGGLMNIGEFDLIVSFANADSADDAEDYVSETVTCLGCFFNEDAMEVSQDDTNITHEYDLNPFWIQVGNSDGELSYRMSNYSEMVQNDMNRQQGTNA